MLLDKDQIIEAIIDEMFNGEIEEDSEISVGEESFRLSDILNPSQIEDVLAAQFPEGLLDDDYYTDKHNALMQMALEVIIPDNAELEIEEPEPILIEEV